MKMRWRSGGADPQPPPLNDENNDTLEPAAASAALASLDDDEQDYNTHGDQQSHLEDENKERGRLGLSPSSGGFQTSANQDAGSDELDDSSQSVKQKPPDVTKPAEASLDQSGIQSDKPASEAVPIIDTDDDDPGLDHAQPPDKSAEAQSPATAWKPQNQQSTCEFTHTIVNYSQKRESGCKKAEYSATTVDEFGNRWRLIVYVNGNGRASNHHLSLFLQVADADDLPFGWKKAVSYVLTLEHPGGSNLGYAKRNPDKTFKLCPKAIDWGWSQFITSDRIQQEGYVSNDSLTVRASVTVKSSSVSIDAEDAELYLKCAVEEGKPDAVKACLAQGASVNCQFKDDLYTPLHTACSSNTSSGSLEVLNLLLDRGADGNACNKWRETPLLIAANNGHKTAVEALLKSGADPSLCSEAGWSALTFAAHKGYDEIVTLLLKASAPVNCRVTEDLSTPLHKACAGGKSGHLSAVKQLLTGGADVHALNKWRETPLLTAANHGQADAVDALLKSGGDPCKCTDTGWSPLSIAAYKGHDDVVRLLLEEGAPTEEADPTLSALLQAATKGLPDTVELLLRHGADHTVTTKKGDTALSILVEQNLIDAAVEMVTEYKASIPRCSRDRKKVQRARLLINLRVKQQQREGMLDLDSDDDETDQEESDGSRSALHENGSPQSASTPVSGRKKKKKSKKSSRVSAEEQARAAEEALLLELEQEDAKAQKEEAIANSKRAKKKKKRERERQQRLKEEQEQREKAEREEKERERQQKLKEEKERKERELKAREQREREMKEATARQKEKEERDRLERIEKKKTGSNVSRANAATFSEKNDKRAKGASKAKGGKKQNQNSVSPRGSSEGAVEKPSPDERKVSTPEVVKVNAPAKRGWETKAPPSVPTLNSTKGSKSQSERGRVPRASPPRPRESQTAASGNSGASSNSFFQKSSEGLSVEDHLQHMASDVVDFLGFDSSQQMSENSIQSSYANDSAVGLPLSPVPVAQQGMQLTPVGGAGSLLNALPAVELPAVTLYREERLAELFQRCALARSPAVGSDPLSVVDDTTVKTVVYRWIVRAAHGKFPCLDPIIPSWTDFDLLTAFFQRQFISENRKGVGQTGSAGIVSMEALKEAGASIAMLCHGLAKDLVQFRRKLENQVPQDWSDAVVTVTASEVMTNGGGSMIVVDWANRAQVFVPTMTFRKLRDRYVGPPNRLLTTVFAAKKRYDILRMVVAGTPMDFRLLPSTQSTLSRDASVSVELWTDPFSSFGSNLFCGIFPDVDIAFGGLLPFAKEDGGGEINLISRGGSFSALAPLDSMVASRYVQKMVDLLENADKDGIPLSFALFLPADCFRDLNRPVIANDLPVLDSRLGEHHGVYVRCAEVMPPGQHAYQHGDGEGLPEVCQSGSLFVLLQNDAGKMHFSFTDETVLNIVRSMTLEVGSRKDSPAGNLPGYTNGIPSINDPLGVPPTPIANQEAAGSHSPMHNEDPSEFGPIGGMAITNAFSNESRRTGRRGRLFELIDDGEDEQNTSDIDVMSGMLNNLNVNLFQSSSSQDVDIEAISLMGIGGTPLNGPAPGGTPGSSGFG